MYFFCFQISAVINKIEKNTQRDLNFIFYVISEYVNFFCLKMFSSQKKLLVNTNFVKMMLHVNEVHEKPWGIRISSNDLAQWFCYSLNHLKVKMVTHNFQKLLYWKRGFPQVQFLLLITFKSDSLALIRPKSLITWMAIIRVTESTLW